VNTLPIYKDHYKKVTLSGRLEQVCRQQSAQESWRSRPQNKSLIFDQARLIVH